MVLPAHDFGSHITRCPRSLLRVFWAPLPRDSEVCNSQVAVLLEDKVLRFDVSVYNGVSVDKFEPQYDAGRKKFCSNETTGLLLGKFAETADMESQVSASEEVHHQVKVVPVLKGELHVNNEVVVVACQQGAFVENRVDRSLGDNPANHSLLSLRHLFERVVLLVVQECHNPHLMSGQHYLAKPSFANNHFILEACLVYSFFVTKVYGSLLRALLARPTSYSRLGSAICL